MAETVRAIQCENCNIAGTVTVETDGWPISTSDSFWLSVAPDIIGRPYIICGTCGTRHPDIGGSRASARS